MHRFVCHRTDGNCCEMSERVGRLRRRMATRPGTVHAYPNSATSMTITGNVTGRMVTNFASASCRRACVDDMAES